MVLFKQGSMSLSNSSSPDLKLHSQGNDATCVHGVEPWRPVSCHKVPPGGLHGPVPPRRIRALGGGRRHHAGVVDLHRQMS